MRTRLQELRKAAGFKSARLFAEHIGMKVSTYTDYEQGRRGFTLDTAWEFADHLGCTLDELAGREFPAKSNAFSADEMEIIDAYRSTDERGQEAIYDTAMRERSAFIRGDMQETFAIQRRVA